MFKVWTESKISITCQFVFSPLYRGSVQLFLLLRLSLMDLHAHLVMQHQQKRHQRTSLESSSHLMGLCDLSDGNALEEKKASLQGMVKVRNLHGVFTGTVWGAYSELWGFQKQWAKKKWVRSGEKVIKMNPRLLGGTGWKWCSKGQQEIFRPAYCWLRDDSTGGIITPVTSLKSLSPLHPIFP